MMPIGPLMKEHRMIEEMIDLISREQRRVRKENTADPVFIETAVDFIRTYADQCHHGKEEKMLFRELKKKELSREHEKIMDELVEDHKYGRKVTGKLEKANEDYKKGEEQALEVIHECLKKLADLYPGHIDKEDNHFFLPVMRYFTDREKDDMLAEMRGFDRDMIHNKYQAVVDRYKK